MLTNPDAAQIAAGYEANGSYTFEGTGKAGSTITIQNLKGLVFGTVTVAENGTWSWTRTNMGSYVWMLDFIQDKGTDHQQVQRLEGFAPAS